MNAFLLPRVAGLSGQPAPSPATVAAIQQAIRAIRGAGERALARLAEERDLPLNSLRHVK